MFIQSLDRLTTGTNQRQAGAAAAIEFWAAECGRCLALVDAAGRAQQQAAAGEERYQFQRWASSPRVRRLSPDRPRSNPPWLDALAPEDLAWLREEVEKAFKRLVGRCYRAGFLSKDRVLDLEGKLQMRFPC